MTESLNVYLYYKVVNFYPYYKYNLIRQHLINDAPN